MTDNKEIFKSYAGLKINYSNEKISDDEFWIRPHSLLFEDEIIAQKIECFNIYGNKAFFKTKGDFPFDIFAASFYLLSRYEEYFPHKKDVYGRYAHENSVAVKENFLHVPLINLWINEFKKSLQQKYPSLIISESPFTFIPTYDIDEAYAYKNKSRKRIIGAAIRDLLKGNFKQFRLRRKVLIGKSADPFDAYNWMDKLHEQFNRKPLYFFLVSQKTGKYDKGILPGRTEMQQLIKNHADKYVVGIHPSWQSGDDPGLIKTEIATLENVTGKKITISRQHYIRLALPATYRYLIDAGVKEDFSMGYGSINGFRASVASAFYWYDLKNEKITDLLIHPFCFMDANSFYEQKFSSQQALEELRYYYKEIKKVNGTFITIWHNSFLGTAEKFSGWKEIYQQFLREIT